MILQEYFKAIKQVFLTLNEWVRDVYIRVGLKIISLDSTSNFAKSERAETFKVTFFSVFSMIVFSGSRVDSSNGTSARSPG